MSECWIISRCILLVSTEQNLDLWAQMKFKFPALFLKDQWYYTLYHINRKSLLQELLLLKIDICLHFRKPSWVNVKVMGNSILSCLDRIKLTMSTILLKIEDEEYWNPDELDLDSPLLYGWCVSAATVRAKSPKPYHWLSRLPIEFFNPFDSLASILTNPDLSHNFRNNLNHQKANISSSPFFS